MTQPTATESPGPNLADVPATSVFIAPDGTVYRYSWSNTDPMTGARTDKFDILTLEGSQSVRYELPADARLVWTPVATA